MLLAQLDYTQHTMLTNKTALITGASRGIGKAIALLYADYGCSHIVITDLVEQEQVVPLLEELESKGSQTLYIQSSRYLRQTRYPSVQRRHHTRHPAHAYGRTTVG